MTTRQRARAARMTETGDEPRRDPAGGSTGGAPVALDASVVICAYTERRWECLEDAVRSVERQRPRPREIIIVIDHAPDLLRRARVAFRDHVVVENRQARGLSGARNCGVEAAGGQIVVFLDDDAAARPGWLANLTAPFSDPAVVAAGGGVVPRWDAARPRWFPDEFLWVVGCSYRGLPVTRGPVRNPIGANMAMRRAAVLAAGGYDTTLGRLGGYPAGCEETELSIRLVDTQPGARIEYEPDAVVDHRVTADRVTWSYFRRRCFAEGLSKARVALLAGSAAGLSSERRYVLRTLSAGVLGRATAGPGGLRRRGAIVAGALVTALGYLLGRRRLRGAHADRPATLRSGGGGSVAVLVGQVEVTEPVPGVVLGDGGGRFGRGQVLVRVHGVPVGRVEYDLPVDEVTLRGLIWARFGAVIVEHLDADADAAGGGGCGFWRVPVGVLPSVSVVVPTRGRPGDVARCVDALAGVEHPDVEVIVVDDEPGGSAAVRAVCGSRGWVRYVGSGGRGASAARNAGIAAAGGEVVVCTDDDAVADRWWLRALCQRLVVSPEVSVVTGLALPAALDTAAQQWFEEYGGFDHGYQPQHFDRAPQSIWSRAGTMGGSVNIAFRRAALREVGGFDERFGPGTPTAAAEDLELLLRFLLAGHRIAYEPAAIVHHHHRRDVASLRRQLEGYGRGMGALLTHFALRDPRHALGILAQVPAGLRRAVRPRPDSGPAPAGSLPPALKRAELRAYLSGPGAYLRAKRTVGGDRTSSIRSPGGTAHGEAA